MFTRPDKLTLTIDQWIIFGRTFFTTKNSDDLLTARAVVGAAFLQPVLSFWGRDESERIFFPCFYQACGISLSLGLLLHGLVLCGHGGVIQMAQQLGHDWRNVLENKVKQDF